MLNLDVRRRILLLPKRLRLILLGAFSMVLVLALAYYWSGDTPIEKVEPLPTARKPHSSGPGELVLLWNHGQYDDLIEKTTVELAKPNPDRHITYLRGYAYRRIGWLDAAYKDFHSLGDFIPWPQYPNAAKMARDMKDLIALRPAIKHVVRVKGKIIFRVYTTADTPFSANVIASLPQGYQVASTFLHKELEEIPVYIFTEDKYDQFSQFYNRAGIEPPKNTPIFATRSTIFISQHNSNTFATTMPRIITHEMTHVIMRSQVGNIEDFPQWFNEGSACMVDALLAPNLNQQNDWEIQRLLRQGAILPLDQITLRTTFQKNVDQLAEGKSKSDAYAQGFHMTRYLRLLVKSPKFSDFLALMRQKQSFDATVKETTGLTVPQFYDSWLKAIHQPSELKEVFALWDTKQYDALIEKATLALAKPNPDRYIIYLRGYAYRRIGWFDAAQRDFQSLGDFIPWPQYPNAAKMARDMKALIALRPSIKQVVRVKGKIAFRVYTTADTPFSANVIASLPIGYRAASTFLHKEIGEIPVYVFTEDKYDQLLQFNSRWDPDLGKRTLIAYNRGSIIISQRNGNDYVMPPNVPTLPPSITHEMTYLLMTRLIGNLRGFPSWFVAGSADMVVASRWPILNRQNDRTIQRLLQQGAILPLDQITLRTTFNKNVDQQIEGKTKSDSYAQGLSMTRYLVHLAKDTTFSDFLALMKKKGSLEATVKATTGLTMPQFYDSWLKAIQKG